MSHPDSSSSSSDRGATSKPSPKSLPDAPRPKTPAPGSPPALASARHGSAQPPTVRPAIEHIREIDQATGTGRPEDVVRRIESLLDGTVQTSDALVRHRPGLIQRLGLLIRCDRAADCLARFAGDSRASTADRLLAIEALLQQGCLPMRVRNAVESIARNDRDPQIRERALAALGGRS